MRARLRRAAPLAALLVICGAISAAAQNVTAWSQWRYDRANTGWNPLETELNITNVNARQFGKIWERPVEGQVYAQPVYLANVSIGGQARNVVYVATQHNRVYAFDADSRAATEAPLWSVSLGTSVPTGTVGCNDVQPEYGVTATPYLDAQTGTLYLPAKTLENNRQVWRLHALNVATGQERPGWGFEIAGSVVNENNRTVTFNPNIQLTRCGLTRFGNRLYVSFGSHCDIQLQQYHGWIFTYDLTNPATPPAIYCSTPDSNGDAEAAAGIWMSGAPPAVDDEGNLYIITGNGLFDVDLGGPNIGDTFARLRPGSGLNLSFTRSSLDYFTPSNQQDLTAIDADLGSGGILLLPLQSNTTTPRLLVGGGKDALLRLINRDNFGGFNGRQDRNAPNRILQEIPFTNGFWSTPGYWKGPDGDAFVYANGVNGPLRQFRVTTNTAGQAQLTGVAATGVNTGYPSSTPMISSDNSRAGTGVVWLLSRSTNALHAFDAANVATELYNSNQRAQRDAFGPVIKFTVPTVLNGRVFVGADNKLVCFGLGPTNEGVLDHFVISGPAAAARGARATFLLSAVDSANNPVVLTQGVSLRLRRPDASEVSLGTLQFLRQSQVVWTRPYTDLGANTLIVGKGTDLETRRAFSVTAAQAQAFDHFEISAPIRVEARQRFYFNVTAVDAQNRPVALTGVVQLSVVQPNGAGVSLGSLNFGGRTVVTSTAIVASSGYALLLAAQGDRTGSRAIQITPVLTKLRGFAIPGDWLGHDRLRATVRLFTPGGTVPFRTEEVILGDDFSFEISGLNAGVFDVTVKIGHWLAQRQRRVVLPSSQPSMFLGPQRNGLLNGDTNGDNRVDQSDFTNLIDLNGDGVVDTRDRDIVQRNLGRQGDQ